MEQRSDSPQLIAHLDGANESLLDDSKRQDLPHWARGPVGSPPKRGIIFAAIVFIWRTVVFPAVGLAYVAFCYVCHYRIIRISSAADPVANFSSIKAGVTSISILIVSLSLLPLFSLISNLKSEEFFRLLSTKHQGVPLKSINNISTPSYGLRDTLVTLYHRHASIYFISASFASLLALATSALAPAVLSAGTALSDGDLVALSVGAIQRNSFLNMSDFTRPQISGIASLALYKANVEAVDIAWAEFSLGLNYSFQSSIVDETTFIIPTPAKLSLQTRARWISDVIAMRPECEWIAADIESLGAVNLSSVEQLTNPLKLNFTSKQIQVPLSLDTLENDKPPSLKPLHSLVERAVLDLNTMDDLANGAMVFQFEQCATGCKDQSPYINVTVVPELHPVRLTSTDGLAFDMSFIYCDPKPEIQTRQITHDGKGYLMVGDKTSTSQGNLHPVYATLLLGFALAELQFAGPILPENISSLGNQVQFTMFFGNASLSSPQISIQPIEQITRAYTSILRSSMKPFVDGTVASAYVPARATHEIAVFVSSPPHIIATTILYVLLTFFVLTCHFRQYAAQFTFFAIASRLAGSDIPSSLAGLGVMEKGGPRVEDAAVASLKERLVLKEGEVLSFRSDI